MRLMRHTDQVRAEFVEWAKANKCPVEHLIFNDWRCETYWNHWAAGALAAWKEQERRHTDTLETVRLIDELREDGTVGIDTELSGRQTRITVRGVYNWYGDSLLDCLRKAVEAKRRSAQLQKEST